MRMYRNDLKPDLVITLRDDNGPVDLTAATSTRVIARRDGTVLFTRAAASVTALGVVTTLWQTADTSVVGTIDVEVEVTWPGTKLQTFRANNVVEVVADFA